MHYPRASIPYINNQLPPPTRNARAGTVYNRIRNNREKKWLAGK
jgi:hypothetical protein